MLIKSLTWQQVCIAYFCSGHQELSYPLNSAGIQKPITEVEILLLLYYILLIWKIQVNSTVLAVAILKTQETYPKYFEDIK